MKYEMEFHQNHNALDYMHFYSTRLSRWLAEPISWPDHLGCVIELELRVLMYRQAQRQYNKMCGGALRDEVHVYTEVKNFESDFGAEQTIIHWFIFKRDHGGNVTKIGLHR